MLKVDQYDLIRTSYRVYGKRIKQIARETGHSKNTIKKVLRGEYAGYKARERQPFPVLEPFRDIIDGWLLDDRDRPKKQRHTAVRVYHRLKTEHGFTGAETTVRRYVRQSKQRLGLNGRIVYIPSDLEAGIEAIAAGDWRLLVQMRERIGRLDEEDVIRAAHTWLRDETLTIGCFHPDQG